MDVNTSSLNMDNWETSDSFSVIVSGDDVLGAIPDSGTHSGETFSETHDIALTKDRDILEEEHATPSSQCFVLQKQPVADRRPTSGLGIVQHQNQQFEDNADSVSGICLIHQDHEQRVSDSDPSISEMDILNQNKHQVAHSDHVVGIDTHHENEHLNSESDHVVPGMDVIPQHEQLVADSDSVSDMDSVHRRNGQLIGDADSVTGIGIVPPENEELVTGRGLVSGMECVGIHQESQQLVTESTLRMAIVHNENQQLIAGSETKSRVGIANEDSVQPDADPDCVAAENAVHECENFDTDTETNHSQQPEIGLNINQGDVFSVNTDIQDSVHGTSTSEPEILSEVDGNTNIGDGIDILAEASLGLISENIFNKESVNQIKDIVASTIANFTPSNNLNTEILIATNGHGYTSVGLPSHTISGSNHLFESRPIIETYASRTEEVTQTAEADENDTVESDHKTCDMSTHHISNKLNIPVTLAEVNHIFGDRHVVDSLSEDSLNENENTMENSETIAPPNVLEESRVSGEEFRVVCGENIEIVESVEICMESSSADVSFESPNSTVQPQVQQHSQVYYDTVNDSIEDEESHNETITFHAVESNLLSDSETPSRPTNNSTMDQQCRDAVSRSIDTSISNPIDSMQTIGLRTNILDDNETVSVIETNGSSPLLLTSKLVSEKPQQPGPMKVAISTSGTSKKVIVVLPSRVVGCSVDKQTDDSARPMHKMRPGVKVPSRNLTSQIVSADEIAKELYAQGLKKTPVRDLPQGGDLFYSRHLTKRLANRIVPSIASTSTIENISQPIKPQTQVHNVIKPQSEVQNVSIRSQSIVQNPPIKPQSELQNALPAMLQNSGGIPDSEDLLAILEGDVDEWSIDRPPPQLIEAVNSPITSRSSPPKLDPPIGSKHEIPGERKLDPLLERELALQQLYSLDSQTRNKKDNPTKTRRKSKIQVKEDFDEVIVEEDGVLIGQSVPVVLVEDVKKKITPSAKKSGKLLKRPAPPESSTRTKNESKSSRDKGAVESNKADVPEKKRKIVHVSEQASQKKTMKSPDLVNGKLLNKNEKPMGSNKEKEKKLVIDAANKQKHVIRKKEGDTESKMKPPNNSVDRSKSKKRKISDETQGNVGEFIGPISRNMPPPPRFYSARIKRSPMFPDFIVDHLPSTSKNKAISVVASANKVKAVSSDSYSNRREQKPLTKSPRVTTPNKDVQSSKRNISPKGEQANLPKKGREADPEKGSNTEKGKKKYRSEIERLLLDEGAINMLYSIKQDEENRRSGGTVAGTSSKPNVLKSARRSHKDLAMKTRLVKNAVLRLSNSPDSLQSSLRAKRTSGPPLLKKPHGVMERKESRDSNDSNRSPPPLTPFGVSSPAQVFTYPSRLHLPAEASRIIRRHSSSSNFSSRSTSPNPSRRLSVETSSPQPHGTENIHSVDSADTNFKQARKKGVPIFVKKDDPIHTYRAKKKKYLHHSSPSAETISKIQENQEFSDVGLLVPVPKMSSAVKKPIPSSKTKLRAQLARPFQKLVKAKVLMSPALKGKRTPSTDKGRCKEDDPDDSIPDLTTCLADADTAFITDQENPLSPSSSNQSRSMDLKKVVPQTQSSNATSYNNLIKTLETDSQKRQDGEDTGKERSSVRQSVGSFHYKELSLRRYDSMVQVILTSSSTKVKNALSLQVLRELRDVLNQLRKDDTCRAVLVTSTGSAFCQGVDFQSLINDKPDRRKAAAQELANAVTKFMTSLAHFNKLIIAGVHGDAVGLGVTMLPFFDMVFASDKATFYTPYARLGQIPEGAAVVTLPLMLGNAVTSELLFGCRKLTASEALHYGLVTRILWPDRFQEELLPIIRSLANQSAQSMEATKALLRHSLRSKLDSALEAESHLLVQHWTSSECQINFKRYLDDDDVGPQRQRVDP